MNLFKFLFRKKVVQSPPPIDKLTDTSLQLRKIANHYEEGNYQVVITECDQLLLIDPGSQEAYRIRGFAKYHLGDIEGAREDVITANNLSS